MGLYVGGYEPKVTVADDALAVVGEIPVTAPSFLAAHPKLSVLYVVSEIDDGRISVVRDGEVIESRSSGGASPCHAAVDPSGAWLAVTNYMDGVLSLHRLDAEGRFDGPALEFPHRGSGPDRDRQLGPHAHQAVFDPDDILHVSDLGTDEIRRYRLDAAAEGVEILPPVKLTPGSGPRHMDRRDDRWYLVGELDGLVRAYDTDWKELARAAASGTGGQNHPSHLELHGEHLYVGNRGPDTIAVFDPETLELIAEVPSGGAWPRHFAFAGGRLADGRLADGRLYVANQNSGEVAEFRLAGGVPEPTGAVLRLTSPSCVVGSGPGA
ncbi:hypothetical protein Aph01nite_13680 [Acrocarpospora phusangensis]|uniref:6-phosphogluconolactonase n=1 Tax=Acrocarpospora phusangensis TaxID=1070424 RepID=A0A919UM95_9ACTN|nr:beta-propeller fold lactonase family protein [Acrocarpospora phusangensis]GIH23058.1 hypothetical protein Aph01nite_13680 [Acrocarpospora phusangensis]